MFKMYYLILVLSRLSLGMQLVKLLAGLAGQNPLQLEQCKSFQEYSIKYGNKLRRFYLFFTSFMIKVSSIMFQKLLSQSLVECPDSDLILRIKFGFWEFNPFTDTAREESKITETQKSTDHFKILTIFLYVLCIQYMRTKYSYSSLS